MKKITIIALHHGLQWKDTQDRRLEEFLLKLIENWGRVDLVAEEADNLPTTVAERLACRLSLPRRNVDMDKSERLRAGIHDELLSRPDGPLMGQDGGYKEYYLPNADGIRERYWFDQVERLGAERVVFLCGLLHLAPLAEKFRSSGWYVEETNACNFHWYIERFGTRTIVEEDGHRWCECRPPQ